MKVIGVKSLDSFADWSVKVMVFVTKRKGFRR